MYTCKCKLLTWAWAQGPGPWGGCRAGPGPAGPGTLGPGPGSPPMGPGAETVFSCRGSYGVGKGALQGARDPAQNRRSYLTVNMQSK